MTAPDTTKRFLRSTGAATFSQFWRVAVTFGVSLLLRRWIPAADWGLYAWTLPLFMILGAVRDLGLGYHVVRMERRPYGNLLAQELIWGGGLVLLVFAGAPLFSVAFKEGHQLLVPVIQAMTLFLFFEGLATVPKVYFEAELEIGRAVMPELARNLVFAVFATAMALSGYGVWSLVVGQVVSTGLYAALLWARAWGHIPLLWDRGETLRLIRVSLPLAAVWFLTILVRFIDPFILGLRFKPDSIGNYNFAYENAFRVNEIIFPAVARALYPALVAFRAQVHRLFGTYAIATLSILALEVPAALFLFLNAELVLHILGGPKWVEAPAYFRILCFAPLADPFRYGGELLKARRLDRIWIVSLLVTLTTFVVGGYVLSGVMGPVGMAWINLAPLGGVVMAFALFRIDPVGFGSLLRKMAFVYAIPIPVFALVWLLGGNNTYLRFGLSLLALAVCLAIFIYRFGGEAKNFFARPDQPAPAATSG